MCVCVCVRVCVLACVCVRALTRCHGFHQIQAEDRRGAELDYIKMFGEEWLKAGGGNEPSSQFTCRHPRYLSLINSKPRPQQVTGRLIG